MCGEWGVRRSGDGICMYTVHVLVHVLVHVCMVHVHVYMYCRLIFASGYCNYRSLPGKRSWAFIFQCRFSLYWALTVCTGRLPHVKIEVGGVNVAAIIIYYIARARACMLRCLFAYIPYSVHHSRWRMRSSMAQKPLKEKIFLGDLIFEDPKKLVKNW